MWAALRHVIMNQNNRLHCEKCKVNTVCITVDQGHLLRVCYDAAAPGKSLMGGSLMCTGLLYS